MSNIWEESRTRCLPQCIEIVQFSDFMSSRASSCFCGFMFKSTKSSFHPGWLTFIEPSCQLHQQHHSSLFCRCCSVCCSEDSRSSFVSSFRWHRSHKNITQSDPKWVQGSEVKYEPPYWFILHRDLKAHPTILPPPETPPRPPLTSFLQSKSRRFSWAISRNQHLQDERRKKQFWV